VRAVDLIPGDASRAGGRSGGGAYVVLVVLAALVAGVAYHVLTSNAIADRRAQLTRLQVQTRAAQQQADATKPYRDFAAMASARVATIRELGAARFDWHRALSQLARVMPGDVWLSSLLGTVAPGVSVDGGSSGATSALRSALPGPAIEMTGCTTGHDSVVRLISRLRLIDGVQRVALADSSKTNVAGGGEGSGGSAGGGDAGDCRHGHPNLPQFDLVIFFAPLPAVPSPDGAGGSAAAAQSAAPAATPAASPTPAPAPTATPAASTTGTPAPPPTGSSTGSNDR
jgi:Tfp pilus assembly protein PilN